MRIDALELLKYGPFTGLKLDLSQGSHGLHVVYGQNEAGKSSALRGLTAALFGIDSRTTDNFVHAYTEMRLAMTLRSAKGERLSYVRRKANKNALRDAADDGALPGDVLRPYLGRVEAEEFERVFGLDHVRLREGSERLLAASEGADAAIVGATLGVNDLRKVRIALDEEAKALFMPRATKPSINAAVAEWKKLQTELRQRELGRSAYQTAREEADKLAQRRDAATAAVAELRAQQRELELAQRNRARVTELAQLRGKLAALTSVPDLASDFDKRRREAEVLLVKAQVLREQQQKEIVDLEGELSKMPAEFGLLSHLAEVEDLRTLASQVQKATSDRERRLVEARSETQERDRLASELGVTIPVERAAADELRLCLAARDRCEELVQQFTKLTTERAGVEQSRAEFEVQKEACDRRCAAAKPAADHAVLKQKVRAAHQLGDLDGKLVSLAAELAEAERALAEGLRQLPGYVGTVEALAEGQVPGPAAIEYFARRYREHDDEVRRSRVQQQELQLRRDRLAAEVARVAAGGAVPSEQELGASRDRRQSQWRLVRRAWLERAEVQDEAHTIDPERPLADAFAHSMERSDHVADQMRRESDRVAQLDEKRRQLGDLDRELAGLAAAESALAAQRVQIDAEWATAWAASGLLVRDVAAMKDTLAVRQQLLDQVAKRQTLVASLADVKQRREASRAALAEALRAIGVAGGAASADGLLAPELLRAEAHQDELEKAAAAQQRDVDEQRRLGEDLAKADKKLAGLAGQLTTWQSGFAAATQGMPGRPNDAPDSVLRVLHRIAAVVEKNDKVGDLEERIRKIDADAADLGRRAGAFRRAHLPQLAEVEPVAFVAHVVRLVEAAKIDKVAFETKTKSRDRLREELRRADLDHQTATCTLRALAQEAGRASIDDLPLLVQRADDKRRLREQAMGLEASLCSEGLPLEELECRVRACDGRDLATELAQLASVSETAQREAELRRDEASKASVLVEALEREKGAAETAAEMAGIEASVRSEVERYVRLAAAWRLLGVAVDHFRNKHETPLLRHASVHFAGLTCGRYDHIETDVEEDGKPFFLVREAATQTTKSLDALSDGTRDQLHLSLVLGSLAHRFAAGGEPMPLVLDDVLVHFDDERSLAALQELAEFAAVTQVILFTHHRRIREQATSLASAGKVFVHDLRRE